MNKVIFRPLSLLLVLALLIQLLPVAVFAEENAIASAAEEAELYATDRPETAQEALASATVLFEEESLREADIKHFRLDDGTFIAIRYGTPVHYEQDGEWIEYDNTLQPVTAYGTDTVGAYRVVNGDSIRVFAADANAEVLLAVQRGDYGLSLTPIREPDAELPVVPDQPVVASNITEDSEATLIPATLLTTAAPAAETIEDFLLAQVQPEKLYSALEYPAAFHGATLRYENYGNTIKESIVIPAPQTEYVYSFTLQTDGLTPALQTDGSILLSAADGTVLYVIPAPYMVDANNETSHAAAYTLTGSGSSYTLTVTADADWINAEGRAFPVLLDPTIGEYATNDTMISATYVRQGSGTGSAVSTTPDSDRTGLYAGALDVTTSNPNGLTRSYFHINEGFIDLPAGCELVLANLYLYQLAYIKKTNGSDTLDLGIYALDKANGLTLNTNSSAQWATWAQSLTWSLAVDSTQTVHNTTLIDKQTLSASTASETEPTVWDITAMAFDWYQDPQLNLGFVLMATDEANVSSRATFASPNTVYNTPPVMVVAYRNTVGVESYYTYQTVGIGRAGTAYIGDFSMQSTLVTPLISSQSNVMPFGLSLVYNSVHGGKHFTSAATGIHTKNFENMILGAGWKLSVQETVVPLPIGNTSYLIYTDGDGTEHYFSYVSDTGKYEDEDGLNLSISVSGNNYTMTDKVGNTKYFEDGYLTWVTDAYENKITYVYNSNHQLTAVTRKNAGSDITETLATLTYVNNHLASVTDEANRTTEITYKTVQNTTCMDRITFPDDEYVEYSYVGETEEEVSSYERSRLKTAYDAEINYGIEFSYSYNQDVDHIYEYVLSDDVQIYGAKMHGYKRSRSQAVFRYYGDDQVAESEDDMLSFRIFDQIGHTISSYTTDHTETNVLATAASSFTQNSGTAKTNNRLTGAGASGQQGNLLPINGSAELGLTGWTGGTLETSNVLYGSKAFKITATTLYSTVSLTAGQIYTFSGYVKVPGNASAYLYVTGNSSAFRSDTVNYSTVGVNDDWQRISVSFAATASTTYRLSVVVTAGIVYADGLQLEIGKNETAYNLLEDGSFEGATSSLLAGTSDANRWTAAAGKWFRIGTAGVTTSSAFHYGTKGLTIPGDAARHHVMQRIDMTCAPGTVFLVSGWAKAIANPECVEKKGTETDPYFGIFVRLRYGDNTEEVQFFHFDPYCGEWQYRQGVVAPKEENADKQITDIIVALAYDYNFNAAAFDNISLRIEPCQTYYYDAEGNLKSAAQTGAGSDSSEYDENGVDLKNYIASNGTTFSYTYNDQHDVVSASSDGVTVGYTYDTNGNVTSSTLSGTDADGNSLTMSSFAAYTASGNHTETVTNAAGDTTRYTYAEDRELLSTTTNAKNQTTYYSYPEDTDRVQMVYQSGIAAVTYSYAGGQLSQLDRKTYRGGAEQHQYYNFAYNLWGQSTSVKVGALTLASYTYEDINSSSVGNGGGNLATMIYGNGDSVTYSYDEFDRLVRLVYNDTGNYVTYLYNADSALAELHYKTSANAVIASYYFDYDSLGRLIRSSEYDSAGLVQRTEHIYDEYSRLSSQAWVIDGDSFSESYTYDDPDPAVENDSGDGSLLQMLTATGATIDYHYDAIKRRGGTTVTLADATSPLYTTSYGYKAKDEDETTNLVELFEVQNAEGGMISGYQYQYDALGNLTAIDRKLLVGTEVVFQRMATYSYDDQNQLVGEILYTYSSSTAVPTETSYYTYTYDTAGNLLAVTLREGLTDAEPAVTSYTYGNSEWLDLLTAYHGGDIAYEGQTYSGGTVTGTPVSGNPVSYYNGTRWDMDWEQGRNLASASYTETDTEGKTVTTIGGTYNSEGIRLEKEVTIKEYTLSTSGVIPEPDPITPPEEEVSLGEEDTVSPDASSGGTAYVLESTVVQTHAYVTQNGKVVRETITVTDEAAQTMDFIYDESGRPFALVYTNGAADPVTYYYVLNLQGDVVALLNSSGTCVARYNYNAWGEILGVTNANGLAITSSTHIANLNPLRYRGYYYDTETGWYYLQSRYYDPVTHRFINADSFASTGQGFTGTNMFAYCNNCPVVYSDPTGHISMHAYIALFDGHTSTSAPEEEDSWYGAHADVQETKTISHSYLLDIWGYVTIEHTKTVTTLLSQSGKAGTVFDAYAYKDIDVEGIFKDEPPSVGVGIKAFAILGLDISVSWPSLSVTGSLNFGATQVYINGEVDFNDYATFSVGMVTDAGNGTSINDNISLNGNVWAILMLLAYLFYGSGEPVPAPAQAR